MKLELIERTNTDWRDLYQAILTESSPTGAPCSAKCATCLSQRSLDSRMRTALSRKPTAVGNDGSDIAPAGGVRAECSLTAPLAHVLRRSRTTLPNQTPT